MTKDENVQRVHNVQTFHFFSRITFLWGFKLILLTSQPILNGFGTSMANFEAEVVNLQPVLKDRYNLSLIYDLSPNPRPQLAWRSSIFSEVLNPRPICGLESKTDSKGQDPEFSVELKYCLLFSRKNS